MYLVTTRPAQRLHMQWRQWLLVLTHNKVLPILFCHCLETQPQPISPVTSSKPDFGSQHRCRNVVSWLWTGLSPLKISFSWPFAHLESGEQRCVKRGRPRRSAMSEVSCSEKMASVKGTLTVSKYALFNIFRSPSQLTLTPKTLITGGRLGSWCRFVIIC